MPAVTIEDKWDPKQWLLYRRWPWHLLFWIGYALFRLWVYYITVKYHHGIYLEYMLLSEIMFAGVTYFTLWLYRRLFAAKKILVYFLAGASAWVLYLYGRTVFQFYYLKDEPTFQANGFTEIILGNLTFTLGYFLFITSCKYFKDGYITQHFEAEKKRQQLLAEINNLKSQIAPHFLFNTLNNLYGLAVDRSDKLPGLMLRLSDLLRHTLYETQKPLVQLNDEISILKSYMELERVRLEDDLKLDFNNTVPVDAPYQIAPLILIVFMENAFKHAKFVQSEAVSIHIETALEKDWFRFTIKNNYNKEKKSSANGIGLTNVKRRLEVLYLDRHQLSISKEEHFFIIDLRLRLETA